MNAVCHYFISHTQLSFSLSLSHSRSYTKFVVVCRIAAYCWLPTVLWRQHSRDRACFRTAKLLIDLIFCSASSRLLREEKEKVLKRAYGMAWRVGKQWTQGAKKKVFGFKPKLFILASNKLSGSAGRIGEKFAASLFKFVIRAETDVQIRFTHT